MTETTTQQAVFKRKSNSRMCVLFHTYAHGLLKQPCDTQYLNATEFAVHVPRSHASHSCILCLCIAVQTAGCYRNNYTCTLGLNSASCALADHLIHHRGLCCGDRQRVPATMVLLTVLYLVESGGTNSCCRYKVRPCPPGTKPKCLLCKAAAALFQVTYS